MDEDDKNTSAGREKRNLEMLETQTAPFSGRAQTLLDGPQTRCFCEN